MVETHWVTKTKKHTNDLQETDKNDAMYTVSLAENKHRVTPISLSQKQRLNLKEEVKGMVIENNSGIEGRSKKLPEYTLVINTPVIGDKNNKFNQAQSYLAQEYRTLNEKTATMGRDKFDKIENIIKSVNKSLGTKLICSKENILTTSGVVAEEQSHVITYSLSKDDATKLHLLGVPMITYNNTAKNMNKSVQLPNSGKVFGEVRKKAIAEATSLVESQSIKL